MSQCGPRRQAKPAVEDVLGYAAADDSGGMGLFALIVVLGVAAADPEYGLEMHGLPDRPGFDVFFFKGEADGFAVRAKGVRGDQDHGQPAVGGTVGGFGHEVDAGDVFKGLGIVMEGVAFLDNLVFQGFCRPRQMAAKMLLIR